MQLPGAGPCAGDATTRPGMAARRIGSRSGRKIRPLRGPRRISWWTAGLSMVFGFLMSEMHHHSWGPFRESSWESRHKITEPLSTMLAPQPLLQIQPVIPPQPPIPPTAGAAAGGGGAQLAASGVAAESSVRLPGVPSVPPLKPSLLGAAAAVVAVGETGILHSSPDPPPRLLNVSAHSQPWSKRSTTSSLLMYVGHMRNYEKQSAHHQSLVRQLSSLFGERPR